MAIYNNEWLTLKINEVSRKKPNCINKIKKIKEIKKIPNFTLYTIYISEM